MEGGEKHGVLGTLPKGEKTYPIQDLTPLGAAQSTSHDFSPWTLMIPPVSQFFTQGNRYRICQKLWNSPSEKSLVCPHVGLARWPHASSQWHSWFPVYCKVLLS